MNKEEKANQLMESVKIIVDSLATQLKEHKLFMTIDPEEGTLVFATREDVFKCKKDEEAEISGVSVALNEMNLIGEQNE